MHRIFTRAICSPRQAHQIKENGRRIRVPPPLQLKMPVAHIVQMRNLRRTQRQHPQTLIREHAHQVPAAIAHLLLIKLPAIIPEEIQRLHRERLVMEGPQRAVADAVFIHKKRVAILILQALQQLVIQHIIRVYHHLIVLLRQAAVHIGLALARAVHHIQDAGYAAQPRVLAAHMLAQQLIRHNHPIAAGHIVPGKELAQGIARIILQMPLLHQQIREGEIHSYTALLIGQPGLAYLLAGADQLLEHAPAVPRTQRRAMHQVERLKPQRLLREIEERYQLSIIDKRARYIPLRLRPQGVHI